MSRWRISKGQAIDIQDWALDTSGTRDFLESLPELPRRDPIPPGLYASFEIDETELDGGIDWPDIGAATVYAVLNDGRKEYVGEVRGYNGEAIWLSTADFDEIDTAQEWWESVQEIYERLNRDDTAEIPEDLPVSIDEGKIRADIEDMEPGRFYSIEYVGERYIINKTKGAIYIFKAGK
ncbi:MAG: hypothetical protein PVF58_15260 [Candidatus Methanofastidiosia archaeon]|jgi:hypothetical protein